MNTTNQNSVTLNTNGYIEVKVVGEQTYMSFDALRKDVEEYAKRLSYSGKPVLGLIDLSKMSNFNTGSTKAAFEILEDIEYSKLALFGANAAINAVTNLLIQSIAKADRTKLFEDEPSALAWLLDSNKYYQTKP